MNTLFEASSSTNYLSLLHVVLQQLEFLNHFLEVGVGFKTVHETGYHIMAEGIVGLGEDGQIIIKRDKHVIQV